MNFLKKIDFKSMSIFKIFGIGIVGLFFLVIAIWLIGFAFRTAFLGGSIMEQREGLYENYGEISSPSMMDSVSSKSLSVRNIIPQDETDYTMGLDAESFEITEYSGTIRTTKFENTCGKIEELKPYDYVVFTESNRGDYSCSYYFKVKNEKADEILEIVKKLKPETLQTNKHTIQKVVDDYTSEIEILQKKLNSIEETLADAQEAYDKITVLATDVKDVESLAKIIDSKIKLIERLTLERIQTKNQIDQLSRIKNEQLDSLEYTFFRLNVYKNIILDIKTIKNSWMSELRAFVNEFNRVIQGITINLLSYIFRLIQVILYLAIALIVVKYGWRIVKKFWKM